nr:recombinase family protein [Variibacter gotjawalensis]
MRCAIYTRVSTEYGLEQEFNSLDAQREASEAYIKSQAHEGWRLASGNYDDGGFSGGSINRPGLQKLLSAIREKRIDNVIVYKVDRLTRSLSDFANLVELFDSHGVSFVSVTQAFNTTTSMGRLTLNVLLSFAQFEREVTGERIRDKIAASKRKGIWMGGTVPLGYAVVDRKLIPDRPEADCVRSIFVRYLELKSLDRVLVDLHSSGVTTKKTLLRNGKVRGGVAFTKHSLAHLLRNRIYLGELGHRGNYVDGEHKAIVDVKTFAVVGSLLNEQAHARKSRGLGSEFSLTGKIFDDRGHRMSPSTTRKRNVYYRYYISAACTQGRKNEAGTVMRISAPEVERRVAEALQSENQQRDEPLHIAKIVVRSKSIDCFLMDQSFESVIQIPWTPIPKCAAKGIAHGLNQPPISESSSRAIKAIALARRSLDRFLRGEIRSLDELAERLKVTPRSARMHLTLAFLSPEVIRSIVNGTHSIVHTSELARKSVVW